MLERHYHPNTHTRTNTHNSIKLNRLTDKTTIHIVGSHVPSDHVQECACPTFSYFTHEAHHTVFTHSFKAFILAGYCFYSTDFVIDRQHAIVAVNTNSNCQLFTVNLIFWLD